MDGAVRYFDPKRNKYAPLQKKLQHQMILASHIQDKLKPFYYSWMYTFHTLGSNCNFASTLTVN